VNGDEGVLGDEGLDLVGVQLTGVLVERDGVRGEKEVAVVLGRWKS
jgi:hypothetical protein